MALLSLRKPSAEAIGRFLSAQAKLRFSYTAVGATAGKPPAGFVVDHTRVKLGDGALVFQAARAVLERWEQFRLGWVEAVPATTPIQSGEVVAILGRVNGVWWMNACRIIFVIDEPGPVVRFGFAYGTLPRHAEMGEERFLVEWDRSDDSVWYDILAFSRPNHVLTRLGYRLVRRIQKRFGQQSAANVRRLVGEAVRKAASSGPAASSEGTANRGTPDGSTG